MTKLLLIDFLLEHQLGNFYSVGDYCTVVGIFRRVYITWLGYSWMSEGPNCIGVLYNTNIGKPFEILPNCAFLLDVDFSRSQ